MNYNNFCPHCMREKDKSGVCPHCKSHLEKQTELIHQLRPFTILNGKYLVGDVLGEGGFGITYIGFDLNLEIRIAIKEFYPNGYCSRESAVTGLVSVYGGAQQDAYGKGLHNFMGEARSLAKCSGLPGIVGVKDFFQENNTAYIVMEYLEGMTLKEYVRTQNGKLPAGQILPALEPVMSSLSQVHKTGLIHRDISPDNIILTKDGMMKLLDFGAARDFTKEEKSLSVMLKPGYAPEEQYRTKGEQGPWSDVYSLAATIYKCITGITPPESMERLRKDELIRPSALGVIISASIENVLLKAMNVYAENRYQSVEEFRSALFEHQEEVTGKTIIQPGKNTSTNCDTEVNRYRRIYGLAIGLASILFVAVLLILQGKSAVQTQKAKETDTSVQGQDSVAYAEQTLELGTDDVQEILEEKETNIYRYEFLAKDVSWYEAYDDCILRGGHLVTIESQEEFDILTEQLTEQGLEKQLFWIGGMRLTGSREYHWIDEEGNVREDLLNGTEEYQDYWMDGEPSYTSEGNEERFMMLFYKSDIGKWVWNDVSETPFIDVPYYAGRIGYICEYETE